MSKLALPALLGTLALFALAACEEDVAQVRTERPFTVFGLLSPALPRQEVYVFPIEPRLRPLPTSAPDARVTTTDLATGETVVWEDSVQAATGTGGGAEYVFRAPIDVAYGRTYRLEVARQDGATARVDVTVPEEAALVVGDTYVDDSARPITPVVVDRPVPQIHHVTVVYDVQYGPGRTERQEIALGPEYAGAARARADRWTIDVSHRADHDRVLNRLEQAELYDPAYGLHVYTVRLELLIASAEWDPPGGRFDPDVLARPGTMSNVENGYGFVGAGYRREATWTPPLEALVLSGFRDEP